MSVVASLVPTPLLRKGMLWSVCMYSAHQLELESSVTSHQSACVQFYALGGTKPMEKGWGLKVAAEAFTSGKDTYSAF